MKKIRLALGDERGSINTLTVILMAAFLGGLAFIIDLGHLHTVQNELRNAADACALRGARAFFSDTLTELSQVDPDPNNATAQASLTIGVNKSDNIALKDLPLADIQVGIWDYVGKNLLPWQWPPDPSLWGQYIGPGVKLPTKRVASYNYGPVGMTLANIFDISTVPVETRATAALSGVGGFLPGAPTFPFAINEALLPTDGGQITQWTITSNPDHADEGGWTNLIAGDPPPNTNISDIKKLLSGIPITDEVNQGDYISLNNGVACSAIKAMINDKSGLWHLVQENTLPGKESAPNNHYVPDPTFPYPSPGGTGVLSVMFPVVQEDKVKFNQYSMYGAITADIIRVMDAPDCTFTIANIRNESVAPNTTGGGRFYGTLSLEPKLVQ